MRGAGSPEGLTFRHTGSPKKIFFLSQALTEFGGREDFLTRVNGCSVNIASTGHESTWRGIMRWVCL